MATDTVDLFAYSVATNPNDLATVVVVTDTAVYRSTDNGATFEKTLEASFLRADCFTTK